MRLPFIRICIDNYPFVKTGCIQQTAALDSSLFCAVNNNAFHSEQISL